MQAYAKCYESINMDHPQSKNNKIKTVVDIAFCNMQEICNVFVK